MWNQDQDDDHNTLIALSCTSSVSLPWIHANNQRGASWQWRKRCLVCCRCSLFYHLSFILPVVVVLLVGGSVGAAVGQYVEALNETVCGLIPSPFSHQHVFWKDNKLQIAPDGCFFCFQSFHFLFCLLIRSLIYIVKQTGHKPTTLKDAHNMFIWRESHFRHRSFFVPTCSPRGAKLWKFSRTSGDSRVPI